MSDETAMTTRKEATALSVDAVLGRLDSIQELMKRAMNQGIDFGVIPGTNSKPTLLKPGAEKLCLMFRFAPSYKTSKHFHDDGHLTVESTCQILGQDGGFLGEASAMCSTKESKYAYRKADRVCPKCGKPAIIKGKAEFGGGWLCWKKKDGCGATFPDNDPTIATQMTARVPNPDVADSYNTVLRIAEKRAYLGAVRLVTGSSALFDEEIPGKNEGDHDEPAGSPGPRQDAKPNGEVVTIGMGEHIASWIQSYTRWIKKHRLDDARIRADYGITRWEDVPESEAQKLLDRIKSNPAEWRENVDADPVGTS